MTREGPDCLWTAGLEPPVTKESLSELDLNRIISDARLRHDLNFEHEIMFRPNTFGTRGTRKKRDEDQYFEALTFEFDFYIQLQGSPPSPSVRPRLNPTAATRRTALPPNAPRRVRRMISSIRDVVKTLVPAARWQTVDGQFDVDLRMQELEHGICDIAGLIEWLGNLLLCSCSPMRDPLVKAMIAKTQQAIMARDARQLVNAIKDLFGVLETMKLDVANHQIRYLRLYLLEDSIQYEQSQILDRMAAGWPISHERRWFEAGYEQPETEDSFLMFKESLVNLVVSHTGSFPVTFTGDYDRLYALQHDFRLCHYHAACVVAFRSTLQRLGYSRPLSFGSQVQCMQNIWAVITGLGQSFAFEPHTEIVLQIVTEAFHVCNILALPDSRTLFHTTLSFEQALSATGVVHKRVWDELARIVHLEVGAIFDMTPLEILNRYDPGPSMPGEDRTKELSLDALAKRTAHVIVLHWRVWAPLLYNQPGAEAEAAAEATKVTPEEEMAERRAQRGSHSSVKTSKPIVTPGHGSSHRSKTASISSGSDISQLSGYSHIEDSAQDGSGFQYRRSWT
ncbi:MAG: hypothetical protein L6R39_007195 [Caloplaca ligustica]|nr:MAG: hypothetical protein L6R39_007195 [Caloplaca ligustica]